MDPATHRGAASSSCTLNQAHLTQSIVSTRLKTGLGFVPPLHQHIFGVSICCNKKLSNKCLLPTSRSHYGAGLIKAHCIPTSDTEQFSEIRTTEHPQKVRSATYTNCIFSSIPLLGAMCFFSWRVVVVTHRQDKNLKCHLSDLTHPLRLSYATS